MAGATGIKAVCHEKEAAFDGDELDPLEVTSASVADITLESSKELCNVCGLGNVM